MDGMGEAPEGMGFDMPMLMNQRPNIYGSFPQDASPMSHGLPGPSLNDEPTMGTAEDNNDAKRRRIARVRY